jgi:hypothetical protein
MLYGVGNGKAEDVPMRPDNTSAKPPSEEAEAPRRPLTPEAERALAEAAERRRLRDAEAVARQKELGGRAGPDPVRYGDWENGGIASDF